MGLEIHKPGQGTYARVVAYVLGTGLLAFGCIQLYAMINVPGEAWVTGVPLIGSVTPYNTIALAVGLLGFLGLHLVLNRTGMVDLLIDTEQEMKKVSWPSRPEVQNATGVVVLVTFTLAMMLFGFDELLQWLFQLVYGQ